MKLRQIFWLILIVVMAMALVACDSGGDDDNEGGDGGGDANLSQTATYSDVSGVTLTANYPEGWASSTEGSISIANQADVLERVGTDNAPEAGEVGLNLLAFPGEMIEAMGATTDSPLTDVFAIIQGIFAGEGSDFTISGDPEEFTTNGKSGVLANGTGTFEGNAADATLYLVDTEGGLVVAVAVAPDGELAQYSDTIRAILGTAEVTVAGTDAGDVDATEESAG